MIQFTNIVALCVAAAMTYGVLHDQFTIRICLEYFTIGHPPIFADLPTTLHAVAWGAFATWWVGLFLGVLAGIASRLGSWPKRSAVDLRRPIAWLLFTMAIGSTLAGMIGYTLSLQGFVTMRAALATRVPFDKHDPFIACAAAHLAAYTIAAFGGLFICGRVVYLRRKSAKAS